MPSVTLLNQEKHRERTGRPLLSSPFSGHDQCTVQAGLGPERDICPLVRFFAPAGSGFPRTGTDRQRLDCGRSDIPARRNHAPEKAKIYHGPRRLPVLMLFTTFYYRGALAIPRLS